MHRRTLTWVTLAAHVVGCAGVAESALGPSHVICPTDITLAARTFSPPPGTNPDYQDSVVEGGTSGVTVRRFSYVSGGGGRATGLLYVPNEPGRKPAVVMVHGLSGNAATMASHANAVARLGAVILSLDAPLARRGDTPFRLRLTPSDSVDQVQLIWDLQRAVDILVTRTDVDPARLAYLGYSYGGAMGALFAGIERRLQAYVLISADGGLVTHFGAPNDANSPLRQVSAQVAQRWIDAMSPIEPICFVQRAPPASILFQSGRRDNLVRPTDAERLHATASQPKTIKWYDSGHDQGPAGQRDYLEWLHDKIGTRAP